MTEADWLAATDPAPMLEHLRGTASDRELRLFAVGAFRQTFGLHIDPNNRDTVRLAELVAEGLEHPDELTSTYRLAWNRVPLQTSDLSVDATRAAGRTVEREAFHAAERVITEIICMRADEGEESAPPGTDQEVAYFQGRERGELEISSLLRCIFGNPFRPVAFDPRWRAETAVALAGGIYDGRHFDRLPILADALEDAGCDAADLLAHLRASGPHARGCWALDAVLGKE